jgi:hypothetical protein
MAAEALRDFLEIDLSFVATLLDIAQGRYQRSNLRDADRTKANAEKGITHIRHLVSTTKLISPAVKERFASRCDELERRLVRTRAIRRAAYERRSPPAPRRRPGQDDNRELVQNSVDSKARYR